jgi:glycosyltransferase 2 family protein
MTGVRVIASGVTLAVVVWRLGAGPFLDGLRPVDGRALAAGAALVVATTVCSAWRWTIVARGLGVELSLRGAVAAYYRALFLNVTLPGGVVGDVHRGIRHGRDVNDVSRGLRAVAWERFAGQVVQVALTVIVLLALPSPARSVMPLVAIGLVTALACIVIMARARRGAAVMASARFLRTATSDVRRALLERRAWPRIVLASAIAVCGYALTFLVAARTAGVTAPASRVLPLALLVMLVMVIPSVGGWGPREGAAAWAFGAAGLGAERGVATAVVYGVMVLVACLPGAAVLVVSWLRATGLPERATAHLVASRRRTMALRTESRVTIASSAPEVWAYLCDVGRWPEWAPTVLECRVRGGGALQPGSRVEQRAKGPFGWNRDRAQDVTVVEAPRYLAFAGPMGTSAARWGMELEPTPDRQTEAKMWIEVDLGGIMRAIPGRILEGRIQRVSDREMAAIKAAVESATPGGPDS